MECLTLEEKMPSSMVMEMFFRCGELLFPKACLLLHPHIFFDNHPVNTQFFQLFHAALGQGVILDFDDELKLVALPLPKIEVLQMLAVHAIGQRACSPASGKGSGRGVFALCQIVVEKGKMCRRDDFYHFGLGIESGKSAVFFRGSGRNQLPGSDDWAGRLFVGFFAAGGKKGSGEEEQEGGFHAFVVLGKGRVCGEKRGYSPQMVREWGLPG